VQILQTKMGAQALSSPTCVEPQMLETQAAS